MSGRKFFSLNKKVDSPSIPHFLGGFRRLERFHHMIGASPAAQWAKDRTYFNSTSPCSSCAAKYHTISLRTTSWCEKHHLFVGFPSSDTWLLLFQLLDSPVELPKCRGRFCDKGRKCKNGPNLPLGSLEVFICGESSPKFQMYNEQKANGALTRENQNANNKSVEKV